MNPLEVRMEYHWLIMIMIMKKKRMHQKKKRMHQKKKKNRIEYY